MIEVVYIFMIYLIITIIVFFSTRYKIISGDELNNLYDQEILKNKVIEQAETASQETQNLINNTNNLTDNYDGSGDNLSAENSVSSIVYETMTTENPRTSETAEEDFKRSLVQKFLQPYSGFENNDDYRLWSLLQSNNEELFTGSSRLYIETTNGKTLYLKSQDKRYFIVNFFEAIETSYTKPNKGWYFLDGGQNENEIIPPNTRKVILSQSQTLKITSKILLKDKTIKTVRDATNEELQSAFFYLKLEQVRFEVGELLPFTKNFQQNTRFVIKSKNGYLSYFDIEFEIEESNENVSHVGGFYLKNVDGEFMTVDTQYDSPTRGNITFTPRGTQLYMFTDINDKTICRLSTRNDTFGLYLTHFNTFNLYNRDGDIANLENTEFYFHLIQNEYKRPLLYPTCGEFPIVAGGKRKMELWDKKCHIACNDIRGPQRIQQHSGSEGPWFRDYETNENGEISGGLCKRYGECPKNFKRTGAMCYEDCSLKGPGWFNGSLLECAKCDPGWSSDGALFCKQNGSKWWEFKIKLWSQRSRRASEGWTGARIYTSDIVNTTTGMDVRNTDHRRVPAATDTTCADGGELIYIDSAGKYYDKNTINPMDTNYTLMCKQPCHNNLYDVNSEDDSICSRKNFKESSRENF